MSDTLNLNSDGRVLYVGRDIPAIAVIGSGGIQFETDITTELEQNGLGYYYFSDNLPRGLTLSQPTSTHPYGRITGAFQSTFPNPTSFVVFAQDKEGTLAKGTVFYQVTETELQFTHFSHFKYGDLTVNKSLADEDVAITDFAAGVYGGVLPYTFSISGNSADWNNLTIDSSTGVVTGSPKRTSDIGLSFTITVTDAEGTSASITVYTGKVYGALVVDSSVGTINNETHYLQGIIWPSFVGKPLNQDIFLKISGGKQFQTKKKYKIIAKNVPTGISVTQGSYPFTNNGETIIYDCKISGSFNVIPTSEMTIEISDADNRKYWLYVNFGSVKRQASLNPTSSTVFSGNPLRGYSVSITLNSYLTSVDDLQASIGYWNNANFITDSINNYGLTTLLDQFYNYLASEQTFQFLKNGSSFENNILELTGPGDFAVDETNEIFTIGEGSDSGNTTIVINQTLSEIDEDAVAEAVAQFGQLYLKIHSETLGDSQDIYYPIKIGEVYQKLRWVVGRTWNSSNNSFTEISTIYIDSSELNFSVEDEEKGKFIKIYLVKQQQFKQDPIAQVVLDRLYPNIKTQIYQFQKDSDITNNQDPNKMTVAKVSARLQNNEVTLWKAWAEKNNISLSEYAGADDKDKLAAYFYKLYNECGYIVGGKPPYTFSITPTTVTDKTIDEFIAPFKIVQQENGRELAPEDLYLGGTMYINEKTPTNCEITLTDSIPNRPVNNALIKPLPASIAVKESSKIQFINSLEEEELLIGNTRFDDWPFARIVSPDSGLLENIGCRWKDNGGSDVRFDLEIKRLFINNNEIYFCLYNTSHTTTFFNLTDNEVQILRNCKNFNELIEFYDTSPQNSNQNIISEFNVSGNFVMPNIINPNGIVYDSEDIISIPSSLWGESFNGLVRTYIEDSSEVKELISNPIFSDPPSHCSYIDVGNKLSDIGLSLDTKTGKISGQFLSSKKSEKYIQDGSVTIRAKTSQYLIEPPTVARNNNDSKIIIQEHNWGDRKVKIELLMYKFKYIKEDLSGSTTYNEMIIPQLSLSDLSRSDVICGLDYWKISGDEEEKTPLRTSGGVVPDGAYYKWEIISQPTVSIEKTVNGKVQTATYDLFFLNNKYGTLYINYAIRNLADDIKQSIAAIESSLIKVKISDSIGNALIVDFQFFGYYPNAASSLSKTQIKNSSNVYKNIGYFITDSAMVGQSFRAFRIQLADNSNKVVYESKINFLAFLQGGSGQNNFQIEFLTASDQKLQNLSYFPFNITDYSLGGAAKQVKTTNANTGAEKVKIRDIVLEKEKAIGYLNNDVSSEVTFEIRYCSIYTPFKWNSDQYGTPLEQSPTASISLSDKISANDDTIIFHFLDTNDQPDNTGLDITSIVRRWNNDTSRRELVITKDGTPYIAYIESYQEDVVRYGDEKTETHWKISWADNNTQKRVPDFSFIIGIAANHGNETVANPKRHETVTATFLINYTSFDFDFSTFSDGEKNIDQVFIPNAEIERESYEGYTCNLNCNFKRNNDTQITITIPEMICYSKCIIDLNDIILAGAGRPTYKCTQSNISGKISFNDANIVQDIILTPGMKTISIMTKGETFTKPVARQFDLYDSNNAKLIIQIYISKISLPFQRKPNFTYEFGYENTFTEVNKGNLTWHTVKDSVETDDIATDLFWFCDAEVQKEYNSGKRDYRSGTNLQHRDESSGNGYCYLLLNWKVLLDRSVLQETSSCTIKIPQTLSNICDQIYNVNTISPEVALSHVRDSDSANPSWKETAELGWFQIFDKTNNNTVWTDRQWELFVFGINSAQWEKIRYPYNQEDFYVLKSTSSYQFIPHVTLQIKKDSSQTQNILGYNYCEIDIPLVVRKPKGAAHDPTDQPHLALTDFYRIPFEPTYAGFTKKAAVIEEATCDSCFNDEYLYLGYQITNPNDASLQTTTPQINLKLPLVILTSDQWEYLVDSNVLDNNLTYTLKIDIPSSWKIPIVYKNKKGTVVKYYFDENNYRGQLMLGDNGTITNISSLHQQKTGSRNVIRNQYLYVVKKPYDKIDRFTLMKITISQNTDVISYYVWVSPVDWGQSNIVNKYTYDRLH